MLEGAVLNECTGRCIKRETPNTEYSVMVRVTVRLSFCLFIPPLTR